MPDGALTCETCKRAPATHVLVIDMPVMFRKRRRRKDLICGPCLDRILPPARSMAGRAAVWSYRLSSCLEAFHA